MKTGNHIEKNSRLDDIVRAALYEGYILYPYRSEPKTNARERFTFGRVYPEIYSAIQDGVEPFVQQTECLLRLNDEQPTLSVRAQFLQPAWREIGALTMPVENMPLRGEASFRVVPSISVGGELYQTRQEAIERRIDLQPISLMNGSGEAQKIFQFPASHSLLPIRRKNRIVAVILRRHEAVQGMVTVHVRKIDAACCKVAVRVINQTEVPAEGIFDKDSIAMRTFASTHVILNVQGGEFISQTEPGEFQALVDQCENIGVWPVLVGDELTRERHTMLASPIILYDYLQVAADSAGEFFDGPEMAELPALHMMSDWEKRQMGSVAQPTLRIVERTENLSTNHSPKPSGTSRDATHRQP